MQVSRTGDLVISGRVSADSDVSFVRHSYTGGDSCLKGQLTSSCASNQDSDTPTSLRRALLR